MNYFRPLDTLRTIAVTLVVIAHWSHWQVASLLDFGSIGVNIFFVISGFLITGILLNDRRRHENEPATRGSLMKNFYIRRTLRIFPVYYLLIFLCYFFLPDSPIRGHFGYYLTYTTNFMFFKNQHWDPMLAHLWSLSVEEQFYLLWPWLIIFVSRKNLLPVMTGFLALGVLSFYLFQLLFPGAQYISILTPTCFDAFSIGALLAYFMQYDAAAGKKFIARLPWIGVIALGLYITFALLHFSMTPQRTLIALTSAWIIWFTITRTDSFVHRYFLNNRILVAIGKMSYGVYLYHNLVPWLVSFVKLTMKKHGIFIPLVNASVPSKYDPAWTIVQQVVALLLISWISWKIIERPINNLKDRFAPR